jgi:hypothetical protein
LKCKKVFLQKEFTRGFSDKNFITKKEIIKKIQNQVSISISFSDFDLNKKTKKLIKIDRKRFYANIYFCEL